ANLNLMELNDSLEQKIQARTKEIEASKEDLRVAKEKAEAATVAKSQFLSNMSHEIRTPLNAIMGMIELIIEDSEDQNAQKQASSIKYSAENLLKIINEILDFSKIEAGKLTFENIYFRLDRLIEGLRDIFQHKADDKKIKLILEVDPDTPKHLLGDKVKLNQILVNLLGNAFKFTSKGYVKLTIKAQHTSNGKCCLQIQVEDSGIGIPKDKQAHIFDSFTQANNSTTRLYGGTGLGLAITKSLVELQGGRIWLNSELGQGTVFSLELPFGVESAPEQEDKKEARAQDFQVLETIKVLIVEDIVVNRVFMKQVLKRKKIPGTFAVNGKEAIKILSAEKFDVVFMDLHMPIMDGWEATRIIRDEHSPVLDHTVPIIGLSADAFEETRSEVLKIGMDGFLTKPVNIHDFYDILLDLFAG
ncbi:MAG: ATP-binding protein, partial [Bacteroidota bacterium]